MGLARGKVMLGGLVALSLFQAACVPTDLTAILPAATPTPPRPSSTPAEGIVTRQDFATLNIDGTQYGLSDMADTATIVADPPGIGGFEGGEDDLDLGGLDIPGFRVLHRGSRKVVENAAVTLKGYDWKVIPLMPTKVSDKDGKFKFRSVPARVAFFLDSTYTVGGKTYRMFGLVRTKDATEQTTVEVDVPSTLVARYLLRLMQRAGTPRYINKPIDFQELSPKDYEPLLKDLRDLLAAGLPLDLDLTDVAQPSGHYDPTKPASEEDSAVRLLDQMAKSTDRRYQQIKFDMQRLTREIARINQIDYDRLAPDSIKDPKPATP